MKKYILLLLALAALSSCKTNKATEEHSHQDGEEQIIEITDEQMRSAEIEIANVQMRNIAATVHANGQLALPPQNEAEINSLIAGRISEIKIQGGYAVKKGQVVAYIENLDVITMQEDYLSLKKQAAFSEQEYERQKELHANKAASEKTFQQVSAAYNADKARLAGLEIRLKQIGINPAEVADGKFSPRIPITAPISGVIGKVFVKTGSYVEVQTPLMELADHSSMHCDLNVYEKDIALVKPGQNVHLHLTNSNEEIHGKVYRINRSFENESKSIIVHVAIDERSSSGDCGLSGNGSGSGNGGRSGSNSSAGKVTLLPGMYVSAEIEVENALAAAVPENAVVRSEGKEFVFAVADTDEQEHSHEGKHSHEGEHSHNESEKERTAFQKVEVTTGNRRDGYIAITPTAKQSAPFTQETRIASKGAIYLLSATLGEPSHEH
ncbi:MAG: efflux RND transporter periplasmic adaptor subunit [Bacteroidales bacterium]|jgi:cobalt-zinc-cadmium efflux system membrane fusion protein|nr:efflux RND transporter periplasmic adaptor subunit [Bacteroidales bacterium]